MFLTSHQLEYMDVQLMGLYIQSVVWAWCLKNELLCVCQLLYSLGELKKLTNTYTCSGEVCHRELLINDVLESKYMY